MTKSVNQNIKPPSPRPSSQTPFLQPHKGEAYTVIRVLGNFPPLWLAVPLQYILTLSIVLL